MEGRTEGRKDEQTLFYRTRLATARGPKKAIFLYVINNPIIYKLFQDFTNHRKRTNRVVLFSCRLFPNIVKYRDLCWELPTISKTRLPQIHIEEISQYVWKFRVTVLQNPHWNTIRARRLWWINVCYDLF